MTIGILLYGRETYDSLPPGADMLAHRARELGHEVHVFDAAHIQVRFGNAVRLRYAGEPFPRVDVILTRLGIRKDPSIIAAVLRQLELDGHLVINGYLGVHRATNKIRTLQLLDHFGIPIPKTAVVFHMEELEDVLADFSFPVILKAPYGAAGNGVFIAETKRSVAPIVEFMLKRLGTNDPVKIQEYIKEAKGKDLRAFVVGNRVIAVMERQAGKGEFRANFHKGGTVRPAHLSHTEEQLALNASKRIGLKIAGVDMLRTNRGPVVIEVNSCPGLEGITQATGVDVAGEVLHYVERIVKRHRSNALIKPHESSQKRMMRETDEES